MNSTPEFAIDIAKPSPNDKQLTYDELAQIWNDYSAPNWDGDDAIAISQATFRNSQRFIQALPPGCALPSVGAEPDGHITLEWYRSPQWVLSISVSPEGSLHYASLFGHSNARGRELFSDEVPSILLNLISRVALDA
ncbi:MAG: hypothetical protein AAF716_10975 [Cyanobacteria bacterium P01_D01_bin.1]